MQSSAQAQNVGNLALFLTLLLLSLAVIFVYSLPLIICWWKLYRKAGKPGWASIVPFYNTIVLGQIGKQAAWVAWVTIVVSLVDRAFKPLGFIALVLYIYLYVMAAKQYDRGVGFWLLVIFLPIVAVFKIKDVNYIGASPATPAGSPPVAPPSAPPAAPPAVGPTPPVQPPTPPAA